MRAGARMACVALLLLGLAAGGASLAGGPEDPPAPDDSELMDEIVRLDRDVERRAAGIWRARLSHPLDVSAGVGAIVARMPAAYDCTLSCEWKGLVTMAEAGLRGAQVDLGWGVAMGDRRGERFLSRIYMAYALKASVLRTWGDSGLDPEEQTLAGIEGEFNVIGLNASLGVYRHVGGGDPDDEWLVAGGVGWGF